MKKIAFILPYFGKFNNYFQLFLNSCKFNSTIDWLIFTDDKTVFRYPKNVHVYYMNFSDLQKKISKKFLFKISIDNPYKLCDYKPAYGYIFSEYLENYDFWGFCDCDLIWGNIRKFYTEEILNKYKKIAFNGHCTLFKNEKENNERFMKKYKNKYLYKKVFSMDINSSQLMMPFDEEFNFSINNIFMEDNISIYCKQEFANIYTKSSDFRLTTYDFNQNKYIVEKRQKAFFLFNEGSLKRFYNDGRIEEYLYIHLQSRKMKVNVDVNCDIFKIIPNSFDKIEIEELKNINKIKIKHFNLHYFKLRFKNLFLKIQKRVR